VPLRVLCPGEHTTATLLYRLFHPEEGEVEQVVFSEIMPALARGDADRGVCIHEGRFTYTRHGLALVEDLGERWERATGAPLPLGGILARGDLGHGVAERVQEVVEDSIRWALAHRDRTLPTMRRHAQEFDDDILWRHVELYVNEWTVNLGETGAQALATFADLARAHGVVPPDAPVLEVVG
jgi:1,4-dihydroxy-6-naphthoate synthase